MSDQAPPPPPLPVSGSPLEGRPREITGPRPPGARELALAPPPAGGLGSTRVGALLQGRSLQQPRPRPTRAGSRLHRFPPICLPPRPQFPPPLRALTALAGSRSLLRAGGAGSARVGSAGERARLRLLPGPGVGARGAGLAGLGVRQAGLVRVGLARSPGRRRAKKSVRRHCAMAGAAGPGLRDRGCRTTTAGPQAEVEPLFPLIFAPRPGPAPAVGGTIGALAKGVGAIWTGPGACALALSGCAYRACAAAGVSVVWWSVCRFPSAGWVRTGRHGAGWPSSQCCPGKEEHATLLPPEI